MNNNKDDCFSCSVSTIAYENPESFFEGLKNLRQSSTETSKLFCKECKKTPTLEMGSLTNIKVNCDCFKEFTLVSLENVIKNYIIDLDDIFNGPYEDYEKYFKCNIHNNLFHFFCNKCNKNLCKECFKSHNCSPEKDIFDFNINHYQIYKNSIFIDNAFKEDIFLDDIEDNLNDKNKHLDNLKKLISTLIYEYNKTPNMEVIQNLKNIHEKLSNNYNLYIKNKDMNVNIEIFSEYDYIEKNNESNKKFFHKIEVPASNFNINILKDQVFINLEILNLKGNNLSDISVFLTVKFENLRNLNLNSNQIGDNMIKHIKTFKFPKLENLDIGINNLQNFEFFESIEHFKELKQLNVSSNIFNREIPENWNIKEIKLDSLEKIDFSNGIFSEKTINFMFSIFKFKNLMFINLMSNNIKELNFIEKLQNCPLETLILTNNEIDETQLKYLQSFHGLKEINLKNNLIKNINEVNNLANQLNNLEKMIVCGNQIDLYTNKENEEDVFKEINEIFEDYF